MSETSTLPGGSAVPPPFESGFVSGVPTERTVDIYAANTRNYLQGEAKGRAQKDFLRAQEVERFKLSRPWEIHRVIKSGVRSLGREFYMARGQKRHLSELVTDRDVQARIFEQSRLSALSGAVELRGLIKDQFVSLAKQLDDPSMTVDQRREMVDSFLKEHKGDASLCAAFGVRRLNKSVRTFAAIDLDQAIASINSHDGGVDAIKLHVAKMSADRTQVYQSAKIEKLKDTALGGVIGAVEHSVLAAALKTAGIRVPGSIIRHIPGIGGAVSGAALGAVRGRAREGMHQIHKERNLVAGAETYTGAIEKMSEILKSEGMPLERVRKQLLEILPKVQLERENGVKFYINDLASPAQTTIEGKTYTQKAAFEELYGSLIERARLQNMSQEERLQFAKGLHNAREAYQPVIDEKLAQMKRARQKAAVRGAAIGGIVGLGAGYVSQTAVEKGQQFVAGMRTFHTSTAGHEVGHTGIVSAPATQAPPTTHFHTTPSRPPSTTVPQHPQTGATRATETPTGTSQATTTTLHETPTTAAQTPTGTTAPPISEVPKAPIEHPQASIHENPSPAISSIAPERSAVVDSFSHYEVQSGDNITWIIKDHMLKSHPELTYGQLDQPPYDQLIQNSIAQLAHEKGVSVESLSLIHSGETPFGGVDTHRIFDPLFAQFDHDHPVPTLHEAAAVLVAQKPEQVVVSLPVSGVHTANLNDVAGHAFEQHLQKSFSLTPLQAHEVTQEMMAPKANGYIPEGSLLDFVNRGPLEGHLIVHYDPRQVLGMSDDWRSREYRLPQGVLIDSIQTKPQVTEWIHTTLNQYLPLRGADPSVNRDQEIAFIYEYMQQHDKRTLSIFDLDDIYAEMKQLGIGAQKEAKPSIFDIPSPTTSAAVEEGAHAVVESTTQTTVQEAATQIAAEHGSNFLQDYAWELAAGASGVVVATSGGVLIRGRHRRKKMDSTPTPPPARPVPPDLGRFGYSPVDPSWPPPSPRPIHPRPSLFPTVPDAVAPPAPSADSSVSGLPEGDLKPVVLSGEPAAVPPEAGIPVADVSPFDMPDVKGMSAEDAVDAYEDYLRAVMDEVLEERHAPNLVGLQWKVGDNATARVTSHNDGVIEVRTMDESGKLQGVSRYSIINFASEVSQDMRRNGTYHDFTYAPDADVVENAAVTTSEPVEDAPELSRPGTLIGHTIYFEGKPMSVLSINKVSNSLAYETSDGLTHEMNLYDYLDHFLDNKLSLTMPEESTVEVVAKPTPVVESGPYTRGKNGGWVSVRMLDDGRVQVTTPGKSWGGVEIPDTIDTMTVEQFEQSGYRKTS